MDSNQHFEKVDVAKDPNESNDNALNGIDIKWG
jgi:hypothetical protein